MVPPSRFAPAPKGRLPTARQSRILGSGLMLAPLRAPFNTGS